MPPPSALESFEKLLAAGKDSALLRFSLGNEHLKAGDAPRAAEHLARAVALDPDFTAAWKLYGKALAAGQQPLRPTTPVSPSPAGGATSRRRRRCGCSRVDCKQRRRTRSRRDAGEAILEIYVADPACPIPGAMIASTPRLARASARSLPGWPL